MLWEKDSGMVNVYKDTIPRFHRDPSKRKKSEEERINAGGKGNGIRKWALGLQSLPTAFVQTDLVEHVLALSSHPKI